MTFNFIKNQTTPPAVKHRESSARADWLARRIRGKSPVPSDTQARYRYDTSLGRVLGLIEPGRRARLMFAASVRHELRSLGLIGNRKVTLADRVKDFGQAQVFALGAMMLVTPVANMFVQQAHASTGSMADVDLGTALVAASGPVAEKIPMLAAGFVKVPASFKKHGLLFRAGLGVALALPNLITDTIFHDSAYTKLTYEGLEHRIAPDWLVAGAAWGVAFGFAVLAQHAAVWGVRQMRH